MPHPYHQAFEELIDTQQNRPPETPVKARQIPLPLRQTEQPESTSTRASKLTKDQRWARVQDPYRNIVLEHVNNDSLAVEDYEITRQDVAQVYFSPHPYHQAFEELIDLRRYTKTDQGATLGAGAGPIP